MGRGRKMNGSRKDSGLTNNVRILVVDKDINLLEICHDVLEEEGYIVQTTSNVDELIARLLKEPPEVLLLDLEIPGIDSLVLFHMIQQIALGCGIIGMSVGELPRSVEAVIQQQEVYDYLIKPFSTKQLKMGICRCLRQLELMKREEEFDMRVGKVRSYLHNVADSLEKVSDDGKCQ
jgi:DNA-binding NtrC family response regulator